MRAATYLAVSADPAITYLAVKAGASDGHPMWSSLIATVGIGPAMTVRLLIGIALVAALVVAVEHEGNPLTGWTLRALTVAFSAVAVWNTAVWITT